MVFAGVRADPPGQPAPATSVSVEAVPPGPDVIVPLKKGDPAPFSGQLFDNPTATRWGNYLIQYDKKSRLELTYQQKYYSLQIDYYKALLTVEKDKYDKATLLLEKKIVTVEWERDHPPWYRTTWFGVIVGVVATGAVVGLTAYTFHALK